MCINDDDDDDDDDDDNGDIFSGNIVFKLFPYL